ncbi:M20 metallopeptidase family protein [Paenibacillus beijingensis]|uniref:Peptidase M20 n=1 Tax=Paenibacillus beijingensis TaxID=1126833 RepID=A0A0D5NND9_9BACL|nr:amidohydrolase [Paenibacillus beijingensis]AJY76786.1 peptidase M20 [Paenibacillus beijingensis]
MLAKWQEQLENMYDQMVAWRRHLHQHPELSFQEVVTPKMIASILESYGIEVRRNVGGRGVVGKIAGGRPGKTIALRADFDALPIQDEKDVPYKSTVPGVMHACGHDGHTATLLAVAKVLSEHREQLAGNVVLLHQHAEEVAPGGAIAMIEDGCLDGVDVVFGSHLNSKTPLGTYEYNSGAFAAAADIFEIKVQGRGGHGASPHETVDAVVVGAQIVNHLQTIVSRHVNPMKPAVVTIGSFHAGNAENVIADTAVLKGIVRTFDPDVRDDIEQEFKHIVESVCASFRASCEIEYTKGYPALVNHEEEANVFANVIRNTVHDGILEVASPTMGSEDFAYFLHHKPGMFFNTGAGNADGAHYPHHHPKFDFDEKAMIYAGKAMLSLVHHYTIA